MGRPVKGVELVDELEGTEDAILRLKTILEQMHGELTVEQACETLDVARSTYFELRQKALSAALAGLAPKPRGRPPVRADVTEMEDELALLKDRHERELMELKLTNLKQEIRLLFPEEVVGTPEYEAEKKNGAIGASGSAGRAGSASEAASGRRPARGGASGTFANGPG